VLFLVLAAWIGWGVWLIVYDGTSRSKCVENHTSTASGQAQTAQLIIFWVAFVLMLLAVAVMFVRLNVIPNATDRSTKEQRS